MAAVDPVNSSSRANIADGEDTVLRVHEALEDLEKGGPALGTGGTDALLRGYSEQEIAETLGRYRTRRFNAIGRRRG